MEPRARAAKNVGRTNFNPNELSMLLTAHGDTPHPLPETIRLLDTLTTSFLQSLSLEAVRLAHHAGRQKLKFEDFQFAMRKHPGLLGRVQEMLDKKVEISEARKAFETEDHAAMAGAGAKIAAAAGGGDDVGAGGKGGVMMGKGKAASGAGGKGTKRTAAGKDEGDSVDGDSVGGGKRKKKVGKRKDNGAEDGDEKGGKRRKVH